MILMEIDCQNDFLNAKGAIPVPDSKTLLKKIGDLHLFCNSNGIELIQILDCHTEDDDEFRLYPIHCIYETWGAKPVVDDNMAKRFTKNTIDIFNNNNFCKYINSTIDTVYVYGVTTDICVLRAVRGLRKRFISCSLIIDAIKGLDLIDTQNAIIEMVERDVSFITSDTLISGGI